MCFFFFFGWCARGVVAFLNSIDYVMKITGLQIPMNVSVKSEGAEVVYALKTKPATTPYWPPGPYAGSGLHRYSTHISVQPLQFVAKALL
jgi:hypothetical protein